MATVLLADDDPGVRTLITTVLRTGGHRVFTAGNGLEAVALFRSAPDEVDLVVIDLEIPVMRGVEVINLIRESRPGVKIICMSGYADPPPGQCPFLTKPFLPNTLLGLIAQLLP